MRALGDSALCVSGFFADSLNRKIVDVDYYINMGGGACTALSPRSSNRRDVAEVFSELYAELAHKFPALVDSPERRRRRQRQSKTNRCCFCTIVGSKPAASACAKCSPTTASSPAQRARGHSNSARAKRSARASPACAFEAQNGLEPTIDVCEFLLTREERGRLSQSQLHEEVFVIDDPAAPQLGVLIDPDVLKKIATEPPSLGNTTILDAYCVAAEGVSHFLYPRKSAPNKTAPSPCSSWRCRPRSTSSFICRWHSVLDAAAEHRLFDQLFERYSLSV